jgi:hypothetical protein
VVLPPRPGSRCLFTRSVRPSFEEFPLRARPRSRALRPFRDSRRTRFSDQDIARTASAILTTREHTHEPRTPRGSGHFGPTSVPVGIARNAAGRPPSSIGYPGRWRADHASFAPAFACATAFRRRRHRVGRAAPSEGLTLGVSSPPRKRSSTCVTARLRSGAGGSRHSGRYGQDPLLLPPREEGHCPKDRGAFRRFGVRARDGDCSPSPTRASPRSRRPALGHCSGGQRLCYRPA